MIGEDLWFPWVAALKYLVRFQHARNLGFIHGVGLQRGHTVLLYCWRLLPLRPANNHLLDRSDHFLRVIQRLSGIAAIFDEEIQAGGEWPNYELIESNWSTQNIQSQKLAKSLKFYRGVPQEVEMARLSVEKSRPEIEKDQEESQPKLTLADFSELIRRI